MDLDDRVRIRAFLQQLLAERDDDKPFGDAESLIKGGRVDSLAVTEVVMFLEKTFGVDFTKIEFDPERFDTVSAIEALVVDWREHT